MKVDLDPETRTDVVIALLEVGVPPTAIARALDMDADHVKGALNYMRAEKYGTDEISEAMTHLIWVGYETALHEIEYGTPASKARFIQLVLSRSIGIAGKSTPEASERIRAALAEMAEKTAPVVQLQDSIYTPVD